MRMNPEWVALLIYTANCDGLNIFFWTLHRLFLLSFSDQQKDFHHCLYFIIANGCVSTISFDVNQPKELKLSTAKPLMIGLFDYKVSSEMLSDEEESRQHLDCQAPGGNVWQWYQAGHWPQGDWVLFFHLFRKFHDQDVFDSRLIYVKWKDPSHADVFYPRQSLTVQGL